MDKLTQPEINTSELTAEVRKSMARNVFKSHPASAAAANKDNFTQAQWMSAEMNSASLNSQLSSLPKSPKLEVQTGFEPRTDDAYHLNDLLKFHDADFLNAAYRAILKREPDHPGYNYYLEHLREGHLDKVDVLAILRFSSEGKIKNVQIKGLAVPTFIRRLSHLPVIGYPIQLGIALLRLPVFIHRLRQYEAYSLAQNRKVAEHSKEVAEHVDTVTVALAGYLSNLSAATTELSDRSHLEADQHRQLKQQLESVLDQEATLMKRHETLAEQHETLAEKQLTLAGQQETLTEKQVTFGELQETLAERQVTLTEQHETMAEHQRRLAGDLRQELRIQIEAQQSLFESSTNDTRVKIAELESSVRAWIAQLESSVRAEIAALVAATDGIRTKINEYSIDDLRDRIATVESATKELGVNNTKLESSTNTTQAEIEKVHRQLQQTRTELALQGRRMALILEEARKRLPGPFDGQQLEIIAGEGRHKLDALYAELEDNFRGSQDEIKERLRTYLPQLKSLAAPDDMPVVDLGCGRGEWLDLLKEEGYRALGVDTNRVLLDRCRAQGLEVIESDALQYLRSLADNSLKAITGFHIIEHLEIDVLMQLLDEIVRVLHPGGVVIFETPNPENVLVGSNYFYFDPTHRNPLPSLLMSFLLTSRGLQRIEVMNLHAWDDARISGKNALTSRFNELFYGPMDYAIAGWKVSE